MAGVSTSARYNCPLKRRRRGKLHCAERLSLADGSRKPRVGQTPGRAPLGSSAGQACQRCRHQAGNVAETDILDDANTLSVASRFEQPVKGAPASIAVTTRAMLDTSGASTGVDVFRPMPSIESYQINAYRYGISAHVVGNEFPDKLEVMVDGRSVQEQV